MLLSPPECSVRLVCDCNNIVPLDGEIVLCSCGLRLGHRDNGVIVTDDCERSISALDGDLLEAAERLGWRRAVREQFADMALRVGVLGMAVDFLPVPDGSFILDAAAGYGRLAAELAKAHRVVALTPNPTQTRFLEIRKRQDQLDRLTIIRGSPVRTRFQRAQFHAAVVAPVEADESGVGLFATLRWVQELIVPGGLLYLGTGNRYGWRNLSRAFARNKGTRSFPAPAGYLGYRSFFREAGMELLATWIPVVGAGDPSILVALNRRAIANALYRNYGGPLRETRGVRTFIDRVLAAPWLWRAAGDHYSFLLRVGDA